MFEKREKFKYLNFYQQPIAALKKLQRINSDLVNAWRSNYKPATKY